MLNKRKYMKKLSKVISEIEMFAPPTLALFDFVGLLQGEYDQPIQKIGVTLDYSLQAIQQAAENNCDLLITHHGPTEITYPLIGNTLKKIQTAAESNLSIYRAHLNLDFCKHGIIEELCSALELTTVPITTHYNQTVIHGGVRLVKGEVLTLNELLIKIRKIRIKNIRLAGTKKNTFKKIAITSGQGFIPDFFDQIKPDLYIAGEFEQEAIKYAEDLGIMLIELGHHASEVIPLERVGKTLSRLLEIEVMTIEIKDTIQYITL